MLLLGGCASIVGIEDHTLATTSTSSATTTESATGGAGGTSTHTGGADTCGAPDLGFSPCPDGMADCDGDGTCEATLATDAANCGACHHDCLGGACTASVCREVVLTPAYDPSDAFGPMVVYEGRVYFAAGPHDSNQVYSAPIEGGGSVDVVSSLPVGEIYHMGVVAQNQADFLFCTSHDKGKWILYGMLADGGTPTLIETLHDFSTGLDIDSKGIQYVSEQSHILAVAFTAEEIVTSPDPIRGLRLDGQHVYWSSFPDAGSDLGTIGRAGLDGSSPESVATGLSHPSQIALDDQWVYWTDTERGTLSRTLKSGGEVEVLVTGQSMPRGIGVIGDDLFWTAADGLYRTRLCALGKPPVRLTADTVGTLSVDGKRAVVTNTKTHEVMSFAR
jgi:hypothetical protein